MGVPQSSPEQRRAALEKAAAARRLRAELKELLKTGSLTQVVTKASRPPSTSED